MLSNIENVHCLLGKYYRAKVTGILCTHFTHVKSECVCNQILHTQFLYTRFTALQKRHVLLNDEKSKKYN